MDYKKTLEKSLKDRFVGRLSPYREDLIKLLLKHNVKSVYIAGSSVSMEEYNDFDIYPVDEAWPLSLKEELKGSTNNKVRYLIIKGKIFQFCSYLKPDLTALINSFDYSHTQAGILLKILVEGHDYTFTTKFTDNYVKYKLTGDSEYLGSEYPLSSAIRGMKYYKRGAVHKPNIALIKAIHDVVKRGFKNWDDFKDQLDAVDLAIPPDELKGGEGTFTDFFNLLKKK